ncbi:MAG: NUMOD4 domain-containing protein [Paludibacteraceae bacterium]|nr:NUMOD4 domain-containing protein [Paludibacteraceae bacterium]
MEKKIVTTRKGLTFEVYKDGRIFYNGEERIPAYCHRFNKDGSLYKVGRYINIKVNKKNKATSAAKLMMLAFIDGYDESFIVKHKDGDVYNYSLDNLYCEDIKTKSNIDGEIWKPVSGFEKLYEISNIGRIRVLDKNVVGRKVFGKILAPKKTRNGYLMIHLHGDDGTEKNCLIHRLVADAFIQNPENLPCVNHKDFIRTNNKVENLEWCTYLYNLEYSNVFERMSEVKSIPVVQMDENYNVLAEYKNCGEAAEAVGGLEANIRSCIFGVAATSYGYRWKYKDESRNRKNTKEVRLKSVTMMDDDCNILRVFKSPGEAGKELGIFSTSIVSVCRGKNKHAGGYRWKYTYFDSKQLV